MNRNNIKIQLTEYVVEIPEFITFAENMDIQSKAMSGIDINTKQITNLDWFAYMKNAMQVLIKGVYKNEEKINMNVEELLNNISNDDGMKIWGEIQKLLEQQTKK